MAVSIWGLTIFSAAGAIAQTSLSAKDRARLAAQIGAREAADLKAARGLSGRGVVAERVTGPGGSTSVLVGRGRGGIPLYLANDNVNAAISTATNLVREVAPENIRGTGVRFGLWEAANVPDPSHIEFVNADLIIEEPVGADNHAQHVAGTIIAQGNLAPGIDLIGMAPGVSLHCYDASMDELEMISHASSSPQEPGMYSLSNHSYSTVTGWALGDFAETGSSGYYWFGRIDEPEDYKFGAYESVAQTWDIICYSAPYYLPFKSAGNDRSNPKPSAGTPFLYYDEETEEFFPAIYDPAIHADADGVVNQGFDTISDFGTAKNMMCVGAVGDAVLDGARDLSFAAMASFSCWGPTDDGRIKPDIVGNGVGLVSCTISSVVGFGTSSGTSMSSPNTSGSAALLIELYRRHFPGGDMRASTLKGLILHTADDLGLPGPDYGFGWGLMNTRAAADLIDLHATGTRGPLLREIAFDREDRILELHGTSDGSEPIRATICWTDPPGVASVLLDDPTPRLVHDLDLRIDGPNGTRMPFVLDPANPAAIATTGDNVLDNVEQVFVPDPIGGDYTIRLSMKGSLDYPTQIVSLVVSGLTMEELDVPENWHIF